MAHKSDTELKSVKIKDLKAGPIRDVVLPDGFIERVRIFKNSLREVETSSLEETVANFQRDLTPEKELLIWEHIASTYDGFVSKLSLNLDAKKEAFSILLGFSMGLNSHGPKYLNANQADELINSYKNR
ncbi:MAG: hypothetical protein A3J46_02395 [Candidatus Yanofskybacteria bacterium RIFCSPHIGHO2_02_FULL_41_11]|uniref:Uncharacterized protein n=1 Tax=Candidatus Yanofskybacteria bacterium RIFCSPHIGHO2_02_FULL_41_11 TaxID=1802675 RepID=A0A1F8FBF2_9BACT|nr:MAG: hypothetical protein A3J46_02395 [Candidatus Yanofskybacteria bacterium RIFCSPHIGHO2_02_FULL_41_11]